VSPIRVLLADDHPVVRQGLATIVSLEEDMEVVGQAGSGLEAVRLATSSRPDVILMDLQMPDIDGVETIGRIHGLHPDVRILILTIYHDEEHVLAGIRAGAHGYLIKDATPEELLQAIRAVYRGEAVLGNAVTATVLATFRTLVQSDATPARDNQAGLPQELLTPREQEVLALLANGRSNQDIAESLVVSVRTVKVHVSNILAKLSASNRTQAVAKARRRGLL
jgi:two-component system, NarL family, response regulator LiaR